MINPSVQFIIWKWKSVLIVLAEDLYEESAEGDEPEPLEVAPQKLSELESLTYNNDLTEARSILALYMAREIIQSRIKWTRYINYIDSSKVNYK